MSGRLVTSLVVVNAEVFRINLGTLGVLCFGPDAVCTFARTATYFVAQDTSSFARFEFSPIADHVGHVDGICPVYVPDLVMDEEIETALAKCIRASCQSVHALK